MNVRKKRNNFFTDIIIDQDESEEGRDCLYKSGGAVSRGHFVALPLCVLGQFSRITSAVMRRRRHHQTSSRGEKRGKEEFYRSDKKVFYPKEGGVHG